MSDEDDYVPQLPQISIEGYPQERPSKHHDAQVMDPKDLVEGEMYRRMNGESRARLGIVFTYLRLTPKVDEIVIRKSRGDGLESNLSLADCGVIPYDFGDGNRWNPSNYLLPASIDVSRKRS